jgi:hypothetical protein
MIELILSDSTTTETLQLPNPPLSIGDSNKDVKVSTLDNSLHVFIVPNADKRVWVQNWKTMPIEDYNVIRGFRTRQRATLVFPELSITGLSSGDIEDVPVYIEMAEKNIVDNCERVENVSVTFTEG